MKTRLLTIGILNIVTILTSARLPAQTHAGPVGTLPLQEEGDLASLMIDGIDRFLLREIEQAAAGRAAAWSPDLTSHESLQASLQIQRDLLAASLGIRDARLPYSSPETVAAPGHTGEIAASDGFRAYSIRWPVLSDPTPQGQGLPSVFGEGLLLLPQGSVAATVIVLPDADQLPEQLAGLADGIDPESQVARRLAEAGCRVVIPHLISRHREKRNGRANLTSREYLHRAAFELGRTLAGYELQGVLSLVDWLSADNDEDKPAGDKPAGQPIAVFGYGEGGMLALFAAGMDTRIQSACVSGFFGPREGSWNEPIDRNFSGLLLHFGAIELAMLCGGRCLVIETSMGPELVLSGEGGGPAELKSPEPEAASALLDQARRRLQDQASGKNWSADFHTIIPPDGRFGSTAALLQMLSGLQQIVDLPDAGRLSPIRSLASPLQPAPAEREQRLLQQLDRHNQALLRESPFVREQFMSGLDVSSLDAYISSTERYRTIFREQVIGEFAQPLLPFNARSRTSWETDSWTGHEVTLDVFPDVMASGVLLLPKDLRPGERRPVVVCQHGLEGRPTDIFLNDHPAYHDFAAALCERGFITFCPQNPYIFQDRFRTLQRKAQPLGRTLFSVIIPQHQQIVNWLKTQPFTDPDRIAFYGLSYGGKSAMRIPAVVTDYCLSICSADFNEWVLKNASSRHSFSYIWTGEYEIFEWDLGSTFNYAEMAALICPRPFMVERGHFDGVGEDHWVAFEYAKVRFLYAARLGIADRTEIEWFVGPHTINGKATFDFLHRHLKWPPPGE